MIRPRVVFHKTVLVCHVKRPSDSEACLWWLQHSQKFRTSLVKVREKFCTCANHHLNFARPQNKKFKKVTQWVKRFLRSIHLLHSCGRLRFFVNLPSCPSLPWPFGFIVLFLETGKQKLIYILSLPKTVCANTNSLPFKYRGPVQSYLYCISFSPSDTNNEVIHGDFYFLYHVFCFPGVPFFFGHWSNSHSEFPDTSHVSPNA